MRRWHRGEHFAQRNVANKIKGVVGRSGIKIPTTPSPKQSHATPSNKIRTTRFINSLTFFNGSEIRKRKSDPCLTYREHNRVFRMKTCGQFTNSRIIQKRLKPVRVRRFCVGESFVSPPPGDGRESERKQLEACHHVSTRKISCCLVIG